jgi:hypothetical protein
MSVLDEYEVRRETAVPQYTPDERISTPGAGLVCHPFHHRVAGTIMESHDD